MKILIINSGMRSGTTLLQEQLCGNRLASLFSIVNMGEGISLTDENSYNASVDKLVNSDNWCCKLFFLEGMDDWYAPEKIVYTLNPTLLVNSYREDTFDQFLSLQVSHYNDKWNSTEKLEYKNFTSTNVKNDIITFKSNLKIYNDTLNRLKKDFDVKHIAYEDLISDTNKSTFAKSFVKQNTKEEKMKLINNIDEVIEHWKDLKL
jgi:hypothetical protein